MKFSNPYWSNKLKISYLQRWIAIHSILYYELSSSIISDKVFDENAYQLVQLQNEFPDDAKESDYWYVFNDFDASTGFYIYDSLTKQDRQYLTHIAQHILSLWKAGNKSSNGQSKKQNKNS